VCDVPVVAAMTPAELMPLIEKIARVAFAAGALRMHEQTPPDGESWTEDDRPATTWEQAEDMAVLAAWETLTEAAGEPCYWCGKKTLNGYYSDKVTCVACAESQKAKRQARLADPSCC